MKRAIQVASITILLLIPVTGTSEELEPYVDGSVPFLRIADVNRQADAWGTCSAAYDIMAELLPESSVRARRFHELGNGASMSVLMLHFFDGMTKDITQNEFNARWEYSKVLMESIPEVQRTRILADLEERWSQKPDLFFNKLLSTLKVCVENLEAQRMYVDQWRALAKSGLLTLEK